ncbi:MAG TPA: hypothetical protein VLE46_03015 [Nitrospira sp.]|nr:hypothetical protein [Nitrospira sp.]
MNGFIPLPARAICRLFALSMILLSATGLAATTAYVKTTEQLDLRHVRLIIIAPPASQDALRHRVMTHFSRARLPLPQSGSSQDQSPALLTLTLNPKSVELTCPGKVLYAPSLTLTESVTSPRTGVAYRDNTWEFSTQPEVLNSVTAQRIDEDLDRLVTQFITDYTTANRSERLREGHSTPLMQSTQPASIHPDREPSHQNLSLGDLRTVRVSVLAGRWSPALKDAAVRQLAAAGINPPSDSDESGTVELSLELIQHPLGDHCPGYVLYEQGLYLVEEVHVSRQPQVRFWSDTWSQSSLQIVPPRSQQELEVDQTELLRTFLSSHQSQ